MPRPRKPKPPKPGEVRSEYHELLMEFREWCLQRGFSFSEGMSAAIKQFMQTSAQAEDSVASCVGATVEVRCGDLRESAPQPKERLSGVQPCESSIPRARRST